MLSGFVSALVACTKSGQILLNSAISKILSVLFYSLCTCRLMAKEQAIQNISFKIPHTFKCIPSIPSIYTQIIYELTETVNNDISEKCGAAKYFLCYSKDFMINIIAAIISIKLRPPSYFMYLNATDNNKNIHLSKCYIFFTSYVLYIFI